MLRVLTVNYEMLLSFHNHIPVNTIFHGESEYDLQVLGYLAKTEEQIYG